MAKELAIQTGTTTFSQIYDTFENRGKKDYGMRFDGNVLYSHGSGKLHGKGEDAAAARAQKKQAAGNAIHDALKTEFGSDFALHVMTRLQTDRGLDLRQGVTRGQLQEIHDVVGSMQKEMLSSAKDGFYANDSTFLKNTIAELHSDPQALRAAAQQLFTPDKVNSLILGKVGPDALAATLEKDLIKRWQPQSTDGMKSKDIRHEQRRIEGLARQAVQEALKEIYNEVGLVVTGGGFSLNDKGIARMEQMLAERFGGSLTQTDVQTLAGFHNHPAGLKTHLESHPELAVKLLAMPLPQLQTLLKLGAGNVQGFDAQQFLTQLAAATGFQLDGQGLSCDSATLAKLLQATQGQPGVLPEFAYRVEVELQRLNGSDRIGGAKLPDTINSLFKKDTLSTQKLPPSLQVLSRAEMTRVGAALNNPSALKNLLTNDRDLMLKLATTHPDEMKAHLALLDRGGLSVDAAYQNLLAALPGHGATLGPKGRPDTVTVQNDTYKLKQDGFGGAAGFGEILLMEKPGSNEQIVLKKLKHEPGNEMGQWQMMSNEIRLQAYISSNSDKMVKFLEPLRIGEDLYMAMECCEGGSLNSAIFDDEVGQLARQINMDPGVELALKLSYIDGMLDPLSEIGEDLDINHHDVKGGNFFQHGDGSIVMADVGTASYGATSSNHTVVQNPEQHSPESIHAKKGGPPYGKVDHKSDCFAFGVMFAKFVLNNDFYAKFGTFNSDKEEFLAALHEHRQGFFMPPKPQPPQPFVGQAKKQYETDLASYNKMTTQKALFDKAGIQIGKDGSLRFFAEDGNPLKKLANELLHPDSAQRSSATQAMLSDPIQALNAPGLRQDLQELRALVSQIKVDKKTNPKKPQFLPTPAQQQKLNALTAKISQALSTDKSGTWKSMGV